MRHRQLPEDLRNRVRRYEQYKWLATKGVDEEILLQSLPTDLRRDIQRHLCLDLVRRVSFFFHYNWFNFTVQSLAWFYFWKLAAIVALRPAGSVSWGFFRMVSSEFD